MVFFSSSLPPNTHPTWNVSFLASWHGEVKFEIDISSLILKTIPLFKFYFRSNILTVEHNSNRELPYHGYQARSLFSSFCSTFYRCSTKVQGRNGSEYQIKFFSFFIKSYLTFSLTHIRLSHLSQCDVTIPA